MSNRHQTQKINGISQEYMETELGPRVSCAKKSCRGTLVEVFVRYEDHGPIKKEMECCECGKPHRSMAHRSNNDTNSRSSYGRKGSRFTK